MLLDRERCIQCGRCTRFAAEIAGDPLIDFGERGANTQVITYPDEPFSSYFSGNTVQICPVGALTASSYRFRARPWDLQTVETSCTTCAVGCRGALQSTSNRIVRLLGVDSEPVNQGWLCDKGRYGYEWVHSDDRVRAPMVRKNGELVEVSWPEALDVAAAGLQRALDAGGPGSVAVLGGARGTNEDAFVWARLAKGVLGTDNVDAQLGDGLPAEVVLGLPGATIADIDRARGVVLVAPDLREELPVLHLRVRRAAVELGVPVIELAPRASGLTRDVTAVLRHAPGEAGAMAEQLARALATAATASGSGSIEKAVSALDGRDGDLVVIIGRQSLAESSASVVQAAAALAALPNVKFLSAVRRANVRGALELGLTPGFLPGRVTLDAARDHYAGEWGTVPSAARTRRRRDLRSGGGGNHPGARAPRRRAGAGLPRPHPHARRLRRGAVPGGRRRVHRRRIGARRRVPPHLGVGREDRHHHQPRGSSAAHGAPHHPRGPHDGRLAHRAGAGGALRRRLRVRDRRRRAGRDRPRRARASPASTPTSCAAARDGAVLPIADFPDEIVFQHVLGVTTGRSWEPIRPGVAADESHLSSLGTGAVAASGTGSDPIKPGLASGERAGGGHGVRGGGGRGRGRGARRRAPTSTCGIAAPKPRRPPRPTRTVSGSWRPAPSTTPVASCRTDPRSIQLAGTNALVVHPSDLGRIGVSAEGDDVRVTTPRGTVTVPVVGDSATAPGTAFMAFAQGGDVGPNDVVDIAAAVTELRVETTR